MKTITKLLLAVLTIAMWSCQQETLDLTSNHNITDKQYVYTRAEIEDKFGYFGDSVTNLYLGEELIPYQLDDMDNDGKWDELAFVIDLKAGETKSLTSELITTDFIFPFKQRTNIRFSEKENLDKEVTNAIRLQTTDNSITQAKYQMEGPAWENDKVGFRQYFDLRNGFDIFGKITTDMALDGAGINGQDYHSLDNWGMDILKVGNSLGAGGFALLVDDELYRLGQNCESGYQLITEGPVRSTILFYYKDWEIKENTYQVQHYVTIWAGTYYFESSIVIQGLKGGEKLVQGIVNKEVDTLYVEEKGDRVVLATHGKQSLNNDNLGMAISVDKSIFVESGETPKKGNGITETYYAILNIENNKPVITKFYACWEASDEKFGDLDGFLRSFE